MKKQFIQHLGKPVRTLGMIAPAVLLTTQASAHPNGHSELTTSGLIEHMLASPFHTGIIAAGAIAVAVVIHKVAKANKSD